MVLVKCYRISCSQPDQCFAGLRYCSMLTRLGIDFKEFASLRTAGFSTVGGMIRSLTERMNSDRRKDSRAIEMPSH